MTSGLISLTRAIISSVSRGTTSREAMFSRTWSTELAPVITVDTCGFFTHQARENWAS